MKKIFISILLLLIFNLNADHGPKDSKGYKDESWIMKALTSAAPSFIGDYATVISPSGEVLREGTNGWTCLAFVAMPKMGYKSKQDAAPACADANAMAWADAYMSQTAPKLTNDGWIWMLHGDTGVDNFRPYSEGDKANTDPEDWIVSGAHLMLMPKDPNSFGSQTTDFDTGAPYVMMQGTPYVHLMIPVEGYYDYQPESAPK